MEKKGKPSTRAKNKYNAKAYDRLNIVIPKGQRKPVEAHAKSKGKTVNGIVNEFLRTDMGLTEEEWKNPNHDDNGGDNE